MLFAILAVLGTCCAGTPLLSRILGRNTGWILALIMLASAGLIITLYSQTQSGVLVQSVPWIPALDITLSLRLDGLSLLFCLLILIIGAGVLVYSTRYLTPGELHTSFYTLMTLFAVAMLLLVLTDDLVVLFVAWEATTLCSFFLIARSGPHARQPAIRTLLVTAAGGLSLLAAVAVIIVTTGNTSISEVLTAPFWHTNPAAATSATVLLAVAAFTKSAQFPFQSWLPDSMVAITPVSAYLHAAAMVKAGIYLLLRFSPAVAGDTVWTILLVAAGLITALLGASAALRRHDLKELLAYSTMSQLGLLVTMIGVGTPAALTAAVVHTISHALFKSALFMLVGVIDHQAGTRDIRRLATLHLRMPATATALSLAAASMAGIPLLMGFISKELMFTALLDTPGPALFAAIVTVLAATTSILTFAYSARLVLGAFSGRTGPVVHETTASFWGIPALIATAGLVLGLLPFTLDALVTVASSASIGEHHPAHLQLWHGFTPALGVSAVVLAAGGMAVLNRRSIDALIAPWEIPASGLAAVETLRLAIIRCGAWVGRGSGNRAPRLHLAIPMICLSAIALAALVAGIDLPPLVDDPSRPLDWVLVMLTVIGVIAAVRARTRIAAVVVIGVIGFAMTLWFVALGAADVAITQLLVEILTVCVMVLLLHRLPARFSPQSARRRIPAAVVALCAGAATTVGVWALTGRREASTAANYFLREGESTTGGSNIVNTILVDFRALDTLGELTVLGVAGIALAALLHSRPPAPTRPVDLDTTSALANPLAGTVFIRSIARLLGPVIIFLSLYLLLRGHYEPGGGFIAALIGGAGFALVYLAAASDSTAKVRWPYLTLIGAGIALGTITGFLGYLHGSFLTPLHAEIFGISLTTALIFDIGVYLAVIGVVLAALNLLGRDPQSARTPTASPAHTPATSTTTQEATHR